eukprot:CAMPEP_0184377906 /NCGR_PEP_ID=MMETSP0007-20130409/2645_1 /TAXON_ID=97485 /ORGANISM="Prymnesium parvum, Strain Texoma1" /LENGTH=185 /DNA_ID=CAMNT_0026721967 /DNA_START=255 /DNA_END=811 /DNA_ORIENTATION=+
MAGVSEAASEELSNWRPLDSSASEFTSAARWAFAHILSSAVAEERARGAEDERAYTDQASARDEAPDGICAPPRGKQQPGRGYRRGSAAGPPHVRVSARVCETTGMRACVPRAVCRRGAELARPWPRARCCLASRSISQGAWLHDHVPVFRQHRRVLVEDGLYSLAWGAISERETLDAQTAIAVQ